MSRNEHLFETIASYTYDWETWFSVEGRPLWINPAVERMTGHAVDACLAMPDYPLPLIHEADRDRIAGHLVSAAQGSSGNDVEFRICRQDGSIGWAAVSWQPILDDERKGLGFRTSMRDITVRKESEDALRLAIAEAEQAQRAKLKFFAAASHDLRQPLQAISMFVGALARRDLGSDAEDIVSSIRRCLQGTNELLDAMLDISRLDAGVLVPQPQAVSVADLLEMLETYFLGPAQEKGLELRVVTSSAVVRSDPLMLGRILRNLVSNAVRYSERGRILIGCRHQGDSLRIEILDSGIGIPEALHQQIFEEFYQVGNPERDRTRGLGLGLAVVRRQARLLGVPVTLRSQPGRGSAFAVEVPLETEESLEDAPAEAGDRAARLAGTLVVAIDDEPEQLEALRRFLTGIHCRVIVGQSVEEATAKLAGEPRPPDILLADYRLRGHNTGGEAIESLRLSLGADLPGILLTGDTEPDRITEAKQSGFALLYKPIDPEELVSALLGALRNRA